MPSSLFGNVQQQQTPNNTEQINQLKQMLRGRNPQAVMQMFAKQNPQFAQFMQQWAGKSPKEICEAYGMNWKDIESLLK